MPDAQITSVSASPSTGPVGIGRDVVFTLGADQAVSVDTANGQPSLRLGNGGVAAYDAAASAAAGADKLVFRYTVAAGDAGSGGLGVTALDLNGATVSGPAAGVSFASAGAFFVGDHPIHVAVADVTADGTPDVVATYYGSGYSNGGVSLLEGDGAGGFLARRVVAAGADHQAALGADVDGDGDADIVATNGSDDDVSVLLSDGAGGFLSERRFAAGPAPLRPDIADVNGDGRPDIVVPNQSADTVSVLLNTGAGNFAAPATFAVGDEPMEAAVADVDGDGDLDIATVNLGSDSVTVLRGDGTGGFATLHAALPVGAYPNALAVADATGDGKADIVVANNGAGTVSILAGNGLGGFAAQQDVAAADSSFVAVADATGDGVADIVALDSANAAVAILPGDGQGGFGAPQAFSVGAVGVNYPAFAAVADATGDGVLDIVSVDDTSGTATLLEGRVVASGFDASGAATAPGHDAGPAVDAEAPLAVSIIRAGGAPALTNGSSASFTVAFSEAVTGVDASDFALAATGTATGAVSAVSGSGATRTVTVSGLAGDGTLRLDLAASGTGIADAAGNPITGGHIGGEAYTLDRTGPSVASVSVPAARAYRAGEALDFTAGFDEAVTVGGGGGAPYLELDVGGAVRRAEYVSGSGTSSLLFRHVVEAGDLDGDGVAVAALRLDGGATLRDAAGNDAAPSLNGVASTAGVLADGVAPAVAAIERAGGAPALTGGSAVSFTVGFDEDVAGVDASDFVLATTGTAAGTVSAVSGGGADWMVTVSGLAGDGTLRLDLAASGTGIADAAGNPVAGGFASGQAYTLDHSAPSIASVSVPADGTYGTGDALDFSVSFDEAVAVGTAGGAPHLELDVGGTIRRAEYVSGSGTSSLLFRYIAQAGDLDTDGIAVAALRPDGGTLRDAAGNDAAAALNAVAPAAGVLVDGVAPAVAVTADDTTLVAGQTATVTIAFGEAVTGFGAGGVTVSGGSLGELATADGGATWTAAFTPDSSDALAASIVVAAGAARNGAGEANTASNTLVLTGDTARPAVAVGLSDTALRAGETATVTFAFTEAPTGFALDDATATAGTLGALAATADPKVFTATLTPPAGVGSAGNAVTVGTGWTDAAGNAPAAAANSGGYDVDTAPPAVAAIGRQAPPGEATNADSLVFRVAFDGPVVGVDAGDFAVAGTSAAVTGVVSMGAGVYDVTVSGGDLAGLDGVVALGFAGGQDIADPAGNPLGSTTPTGTDDGRYVLDNTAPYVASVSSPPVGTYRQAAALDFAVSFDEAVTAVAAPGGGAPYLEIDVGGAARRAEYVSGSGTSSLLFRYAVQPGDGDGVAVAALRLDPGAALRDAAGNDAAPALDGVAPTAGVLVDGAPPGVASIARANDAGPLTNGSSASFTVAFSEAVTGVDASDFVLATTGTAAGAIASVSGGGATRTVTVSDLVGDGELRLDLAPSGTGIADAAGNPLTGGFASGQAYVLDHTAPGAPEFASMPNDTGAPGDLVTAAASPELRFRAPGADAVRVYRAEGGQREHPGDASRGAGDDWTFALAGAPEGTHTVVAEALDAAGNASAPSDPASILVDRQGPVANPDIGIRIQEGASDRPLVELRGAVSDANTAPGSVVLTLTSAPAHGSLELGGAALAAGDRFTLADVWAGLVSYTHDGNGPSVDGFGFEAGDGASADPRGRLAIEVRRAPAAGDVVYGGGGDDLIYTPDGGATIVASGGDDTVFGGAGLDAVRYGGLRNLHAVTDGSGLPERVAGPLGTSAVSGVETLEFLDGRVEYAPGGAAHLVERLYAGVLGRPADAEGMSFWSGKLDGGWGADRVAQAMAGAREHAGLPPAGQDAFLRGLYRDVLHRDADAEGLASWARTLDEGATTRAAVAAAVAESAEAVSLGTAHPVVVADHGMLVAARAYRVVLGREPDLDGLRFWDGRIDAGGLSDGDVGRAFASTAEFQARHGGTSDAAFVDALYGQAFGRPGEDPGRSGWLDALAAGASRQEVAVGFLLAEEGLAHRAQLAADGLSLIG